MISRFAAKSAVDPKKSATAKLFYLELSAGRIYSMNTDGSERKLIITGCHLPDGIAVDVENGHIYWTNMGVPNLNDGSIERANIDGGNRVTVIPVGVTHTPKQLHLDKSNRKLYWADREGMRVMRSNLNGSKVETLIQTGQGAADSQDQTRWCVGIALDYEFGHVYWTQKGPDNAGLGRIYRANIEMPAGATAVSRPDVEVWLENLPEPIDLEIDPDNRILYWTDRGDPPQGNTVNRAPLDAGAENRAPEIIFTHLMEGIGIALDAIGNRMFMTDLGGSVYSAHLDGTDKRVLQFAQGNVSGIAYAEFPSMEHDND
ncbi:MAG TPA: hypothetical protein VFI23_11575 [Rhizomicrobium sp.]|nr:hypothetical protein [Rhizomicrobium sp.]